MKAAQPGPNTVCEDCVPSPKAQALTLKDNGLQLGGCAELYKVWSDCIEQANGQVTSCTHAMRAFRKCHADSAAEVPGNVAQGSIPNMLSRK